MLATARTRANKQLAHLTVDRLKWKRESWKTKEIIDALRELNVEFLGALSEERRAWFLEG